MLHVVNGDILQAEVDAIVVPINCVGTMGAGLAKAVKQHSPVIHQWYVDLYITNKLYIGAIHATKMTNGKYFIMFPTKYDWRDPSETEYIEKGLATLRQGLLSRTHISSVAIPALGCGLGGLDFNVVKQLVDEYLSDVPQEIYLYAPQ